MKRLGMFTGTIYPDDYDFSQCPECCTMISDGQAEDKNFIARHHAKDLLSCLYCRGCPAAMEQGHKYCV